MKTNNVCPCFYSIPSESNYINIANKPTGITKDEFLEINPDANVTFQSYEEITLKDGFWAKAGSTFTAQIITPCSGCRKNLNYADAPKISEEEFQQILATIPKENYNTENGIVSNNTQHIFNDIKLESKDILTIFFTPNPFKDLLTIETNNDIQGLVKINNLMGEFVLENLYSGKKLVLPLQQLSAGVYFISFTSSKGEVYQQKIVKQ